MYLCMYSLSDEMTSYGGRKLHKFKGKEYMVTELTKILGHIFLKKEGILHLILLIN